MSNNMQKDDVFQRVIQAKIEALSHLANQKPEDFDKIVDFIIKKLEGRVIISGVGKSGHIGKKIAASLASTGTPSFFVHSCEASHGDLGMITKQDLVLLISNSGETREIFDIINYCKKSSVPIAAITSGKTSSLAKAADFLLLIPAVEESSNVKAPTSSALITLAVGSALAIALHEKRDFKISDFKNFHPGGTLGSILT